MGLPQSSHKRKTISRKSSLQPPQKRSKTSSTVPEKHPREDSMEPADSVHRNRAPAPPVANQDDNPGLNDPFEDSLPGSDAESYKAPEEAEPFPDFVNPLLFSGEVEEVEHCMVHCRHRICKAQREYNESKPGHLPAPRCKCDLPGILPGTEDAKSAGPVTEPPKLILEINEELIELIDQLIKHAGLAETITVQEDEIPVILRAISKYFIEVSPFYKALCDGMETVPATSGKNAGLFAHNTLARGLSDYFWDTLASHGEEGASQRRSVALTTLTAELDIYQCMLMKSVLRRFHSSGRVTDSWMTPGEIRSVSLQYVSMNIVWIYWSRTVSLLLKILQWRDIERRNALN